MLSLIPLSSAILLRWSAALVCALMLGLAAPSAQAPAPPNDDLSQATPLPPGTLTGTTVGATRGHDEYGALCTPGGPAADNLETVWWEYSRQTSTPGRITVDLTGTDFDAVLTVQSGGGDIYACAIGPNARIENIPTQSDVPTSIRVSGVGAARGTVVITLTRDDPKPAPNDDFADATPITADGYYFETNTDATREPGEANASCESFDKGASLWWAYTAPRAGDVRFDIGFSYSRILSLHDASGGELACDLERIEGYAMAAGETVWVRTSSSSLNTGFVQLQVWNGDAGRPANDDRSQAAPLVREGIYSGGTTAGATSEPGEAPASCAPDAGRSVWWRIDNSVPIQLAVRVNGTRVLSVYDAAGTELACSATPGEDRAVRLDDVMLPAGPVFLRVSDPAGTPYGSSVYFTFYVAPELTNDDRADAVAIAGPGVVLGTTVNATAEADEPVLPGGCYFHPGTDTNESAWWSYTAPADGTLLVDLDGSDFDTLLSFHDEDLALLGCDDDDSTNDPLDNSSRLANVPVAAGQRVLIRVSGKYTNTRPGRATTGDVQLRLDLFPAASTTTVATGTTAGEPLWSYPDIYGLMCNSAFVDTPYRADPFTVPTSGFYTFTGTFTGYVGGVFVMRTPFDAETWECDDLLTHGYGTDADPSIAQGRPVELEAGVDYVLVASEIAVGFDFEFDGGPYTITALGPAPVSFLSLTAAEGPAAAGGASLSAPRPNPARSGAALTLSLGAAETVTVEVLNALGQRVAVLQDGPLTAGAHDLRLDALALAPGLYLVRATGETFARTQRLTVVR